MNQRKNNLAINEVNETLKEGTLSLFEKERYKDYLGAVSQFPEYSSNNQTLIYIQSKGTATMVCGYEDWKKKHGRHVVKGGRGLKILAPKKKTVMKEKKDANGNTVYDKDGNPVMAAEKEFAGFCVKTVFDVSQTAGKPILSITALFSGNVDGYSELLDIMSDVSPVPISFGETNQGYMADKEEIAVKSDMSQQQIIQALIPSVAGAVLKKQGSKSYSHDGLEAESVAYIVASHFGIEADYDFDYITDWSAEKELSELTASLKTIQKAASSMIKDIEKCRKALA